MYLFIYLFIWFGCAKWSHIQSSNQRNRFVWYPKPQSLKLPVEGNASWMLGFSTATLMRADLRATVWVSLPGWSEQYRGGSYLTESRCHGQLLWDRNGWHADAQMCDTNGRTVRRAERWSILDCQRVLICLEGGKDMTKLCSKHVTQTVQDRTWTSRSCQPITTQIASNWPGWRWSCVNS